MLSPRHGTYTNGTSGRGPSETDVEVRRTFRVTEVKMMTAYTGSRSSDESMVPAHRIISGCSRLDVPIESWAGRIPLKRREQRPSHPRSGDDTVIIHDWPLLRVGASSDDKSCD